MKPEWLAGTNLTRFDVPGLCNQIWADPTGVSCTDVDQMAGCVLGGGTAVNAGLWWKPHPADWDTNFPAGWQAKDMAAATQRVFTRIPGTTTPSMDGKRYLAQGFDVLGGSLGRAGWMYVTPNEHPEQKNRTYGPSTFMFSFGERGGPLATYLASAHARGNFTLWTNTVARRVIRTGGHATGVEIECNGGGHAGVVSVTPTTGRVVLAAGAFGSAKLLFRSTAAPFPAFPVIVDSFYHFLTHYRRHRPGRPTQRGQELDRRAHHDLVRPVDQPSGWLQSQRSRWRTLRVRFLCAP